VYHRQVTSNATLALQAKYFVIDPSHHVCKFFLLNMNFKGTLIIFARALRPSSLLVDLHLFFCVGMGKQIQYNDHYIGCGNAFWKNLGTSFYLSSLPPYY
jgi:hypothetical protein